MNAIRNGCFRLAVACLYAAYIGACSKLGHNDVSTASSAAPGIAGLPSSPVDSVAARRTEFVSQRHRFSVRYPDGAQPKFQELGKIDTAIGDVTNFSYFTGVGDTAYEVTVSVYPSGKLSPDIDGLLQVTRDDALARPGASLVTEQRISVKTSRGRAVQAHFIEVRMNGAHIYRVTCFFENFSYHVSAGGRFGDTTMRRETFDEFVASFRLLENVAL